MLFVLLVALQDDVGELIEELGPYSLKEREEALQKAANGLDPEVAYRARQLLLKLPFHEKHIKLPEDAPQVVVSPTILAYRLNREKEHWVALTAWLSNDYLESWRQLWPHFLHACVGLSSLTMHPPRRTFPASASFTSSGPG